LSFFTATRKENVHGGAAGVVGQDLVVEVDVGQVEGNVLAASFWMVSASSSVNLDYQILSDDTGSPPWTFSWSR